MDFSDVTLAACQAVLILLAQDEAPQLPLVAILEVYCVFRKDQWAVWKVRLDNSLSLCAFGNKCKIVHIRNLLMREY